MEYHVTITATRLGLSPKQQRGFVAAAGVLIGEAHRLLAKEVWFHHGDCRGGDAEAHAMLLELRETYKHLRIMVHPPVDEKDRAFVAGADAMADPETYLKRNRTMVDMSQGLIGLPPTIVPQDRGGTWYTIKYAQRQGLYWHIIGPEGEYEKRTA